MRFNAVIVLALLLTDCAHAADVTGVVSILPSRAVKAREPASDGVPVVWLEAIDANATVAPRHATMIQKNKRFSPHELVVGVGSTVDFPNLDPIFHNAFSSFDGQVFDIGLYPPGKSRSIQFRRPGVVRVFCNIHPAMAALILVLNSPYWTQASSNGSYSLVDVPTGIYRLHVFYERASPESLSALSQVITVTGAKVQLPVVQIAESQYLALPHKNKYGKDYPPGDSTYGLPQ